MGVDWPISYENIAPYYDRVERLVGVFGSSEGFEKLPNSPTSPEGVLLPAPKLRVGELYAQQPGAKDGARVLPMTIRRRCI